jgi:NDP-sugar pyrophosphorylase family protein
MDYFGDGSKFGVGLRFSREREPLGTAGGVKKAERYLDERFAVIQGDNVTAISLMREMMFHKRKQGVATIALKRFEKPWRFGVAELEDSKRVKRFAEKPKPKECFSDLVSLGLYVFEPDVLDLIPSNKEYDFAKDLFPDLLRRNLPIYGFQTRAFWVDVGHVDGYIKATRWVLRSMTRHISPQVETRGSDIKGTVWVESDVRIRPGTTINGPAIIENGSTIHSDAYIGPGTVLKNGVEIGSQSRLHAAIIFENTELRSETTLRRCVVAEECTIGSKVRIDELSIVGPRCRVGDRTRIMRESRIWPNLEIRPESTISGIIK